jgi:hypothetical protein
MLHNIEIGDIVSQCTGIREGGGGGGRNRTDPDSLEPEFVNLLRSPGIDSQPDGAGTITLFDVPSRQAT